MSTFLGILYGPSDICPTLKLVTRADSSDAHDDSLTMETLIEDSRDSLQQAISLRRVVMEELNSICPSPPSSYTCIFDRLESKVFEKYVWYIRMWVEAYSSEGRDSLRLFLFIETEMKRAMDIARTIPEATTTLFKTMIMVCTDLVRRCIVDEWQSEIARVNEEAATYDLMGEDYEDEEREEEDDEDVYLDDPSVLFTCRMYNTLLRSAQDRTTRILAIIRRVVEECKNGVIMEIQFDSQPISNDLSNYCMVEWSEETRRNLSLFVDSNSVDNGRVDELIVSMGEGRKIVEGQIIMCSESGRWNGRIVKCKGDLNRILRFTIPFLAVDFTPAFELESDLPEVKLFGKWNLQEVNVADISLVDYITVKEKYAKYLPHSAGRYQVGKDINIYVPICITLPSSFLKAPCKPRAGARQRRYHVGPVKTLLVLDAPVPSVVNPSTWLPSDVSTRKQTQLSTLQLEHSEN
ncbi:hypothetical protein PRIPAC_86447 [Pristionchus pacificus]|uniref:Uncharacterized protein n=1 Tax=Pristionchus pacificus TaxID=54126 RepID=A0A2A6BGV2_PRIPA|nr:hypothetical protein PRIPAC_86447 [Pristionchus pacificus]|eukprot:PDM65145.1 hypothetical protein PRIPAC_53394 [Pristionchus pacificus]